MHQKQIQEPEHVVGTTPNHVITKELFEVDCKSVKVTVIFVFTGH